MIDKLRVKEIEVVNKRGHGNWRIWGTSWTEGETRHIPVLGFTSPDGYDGSYGMWPLRPLLTYKTSFWIHSGKVHGLRYDQAMLEQPLGPGLGQQLGQATGDMFPSARGSAIANGPVRTRLSIGSPGSTGLVDAVFHGGRAPGQAPTDLDSTRPGV